MKSQNQMELKEFKLYQPVKNWLEAQGYEVFPEVQKYGSPSLVDVVGKKDEDLILIELKQYATKTLLRQCTDAQLDSEKVFAAVSKMPLQKSIDKFQKFGIGILIVNDSSVSQLCPPIKRREIDQHSKKILISRLFKRPDDFVAGLPCMAGTGPAQDCEKRVTEYKNQNPKATWKQIFECVPNHYSSPASMQSAMYKVRDRNA